MAFATINGITVHHELIGEARSKKLIVFSNSLGTDFRIWLPLFDELPEDVSVLLYDSRGHGLSGGGDETFTMDDLIEDLGALVDHVGVKKAIFCGLSVGGMIVQGLWSRRPELFTRMILCDTAPKIGSADTWNARIEAIAKDGLSSISDNVMERWFTSDFHEERLDELAGYKLMMERQPADGYTQTCISIRDADFTDIASSISVPTLCVVGDQDGSTPPDLVRKMAELIPGAAFEEIASCGHIPCVEQPEILGELIETFLRKT